MYQGGTVSTIHIITNNISLKKLLEYAHQSFGGDIHEQDLMIESYLAGSILGIRLHYTKNFFRMNFSGLVMNFHNKQMIRFCGKASYADITRYASEKLHCADLDQIIVMPVVLDDMPPSLFVHI